GIYTDHHCFGGRARWGATFGGYKNADGNGHGTLLSDEGSGSWSDIIAGIQYASNSFEADPKPSIATMSLGGEANNAVDDAVKAAIAKGLHFTVAAGNSHMPADTTSPARVQEANTIGAVDSNNQTASFSNFGPLLDVWYLGVNVLSAWIDGPDSTKVLSGTSMSTPGVASILAAYLSKVGNGKLTPAELTTQLTTHAEHSVKFVGPIPPVDSTDLLAVPF
ncbi:subtilisin-like serine protease, partial [Ceratobasidium sp. 414]